MKLLIAVTSDISLRLLQGQLDYLLNEGFEIHLVVSSGEYSKDLRENAQFKVHYIDMAREISLKKDISSLFKMIRVFRTVKPDISNVGTPKAALLGSIASFITGTKRRIYTLRGLRLETTQGVKRIILKYMEQLTILLSTEVIAISPSLIEKCGELGITGQQKMLVLGKGSSNGLDIEKFDKLSQESCPRPFTNSDFVIGFTGRLTKDKGIDELIEAYNSFKDTNLLLVGELEQNHGLKDETIQEIKTNPNIVVTGFLSNPAPYYQYMDVFVIPSYREGFSNVCIEAAAAQLPVIGTDVTGIKDAVVHDETGYLVSSHSGESLKYVIANLKKDPKTRKKFGENGRQRVINDFQSENIWKMMVKFYQKERINDV